jgi:hypothetical protein
VSALCRWRPGGSGGPESGGGVVAVRGARLPAPAPSPACGVAAAGVRSAVWFGSGRFGSGTGVTGGVTGTGLELRPGFWARRWSADSRAGSRREEGRGGSVHVCSSGVGEFGQPGSSPQRRGGGRIWLAAWCRNGRHHPGSGDHLRGLGDDSDPVSRPRRFSWSVGELGVVPNPVAVATASRRRPALPLYSIWCKNIT